MVRLTSKEAHNSFACPVQCYEYLSKKDVSPHLQTKINYSAYITLSENSVLTYDRVLASQYANTDDSHAYHVYIHHFFTTENPNIAK